MACVYYSCFFTTMIKHMVSSLVAALVRLRHGFMGKMTSVSIFQREAIQSLQRPLSESLYVCCHAFSIHPAHFFLSYFFLSDGVSGLWTQRGIILAM